MNSSMLGLPNEILHQTLGYLEPQDFPNVCLVSRRCYTLVDSLNWRWLCQKHFRYWDPSRRTKVGAGAIASGVDWKTVFIARRRLDRNVTAILNSILATQKDRIEKFQQIVDIGYEAKDALLRHVSVDSGADDVLSRRYYSAAALGSLHRSMAIREWLRLNDTEDLPLETALAAFDMFVLHDRVGDFTETTNRLDTIATSIRDQLPDLDEQSPRQKALHIVRYLRQNNLTGISPERGNRYHDLRNNFIGLALQDSHHPSLPLISTAIFCSLARRLDVDAQPCGFPLHVVAIVRPPPGRDLDSQPDPGGSASPLYLDPFQSDQEVPVASLISRLRLVGASESSHATLLDASSSEDMVLRTGRNIMRSLQETDQQSTSRHTTQGDGVPSPAFPNIEQAVYGALWSLLLLGRPQIDHEPAVAPAPRRNFIRPFVEQVMTHFSMDASLVEKHILPLFQESVELTQLQGSIRVMRSLDSTPKQPKCRSGEAPDHPRYKIGQVFVHKRYQYVAVITGWDVECSADEEWMARMQVHELVRGKHQSFYHVLADDKSIRYVAEENIEIVRLATSPLLEDVGRYFKRWDRHSSCFVSNMRDEYPDD